jgi:hypothetical protein
MGGLCLLWRLVLGPCCVVKRCRAMNDIPAGIFTWAPAVVCDECAGLVGLQSSCVPVLDVCVVATTNCARLSCA